MFSKVNVIVKAIYDVAEKKCKDNGYDITIENTFISKQDQCILYCRGRSKEQCIKAGIPKYLIDSLNFDYMIKMDKVVNSLHSIHYEGRAIDIRCDDEKYIKEVKSIFESYGFTVRYINGYKLHLEIPGHYQNTLKPKLYNPNVLNAIKNVFNKILNKKLIIDGIWDEEFTNALVEYKMSNNNICTDLYIDTILLKDILRRI